MKLFRILAATAITFGASSVWADLIREDSTACSPTIHLKVPATWINAFISLGDTAIAFPKADANGWSTISLADKSITKNATKFFINNNSGRSCYKHACISPEGIYKSTIYEYFTCSTFKEDKAEVWIQEHPDPSKKNQIYMTYKEPVIHDFYVFVPSNQSWLIGNPIIEENGKPHEMYPDPSYLGWYIRRYIDEEIPSSVLIYHEGDEDKKEAIGMKGEWETSATPTPIPLVDFFELFSSEPDYSNALYFVADKEEASKLPAGNDGWYIKHPTSEGSNMRELIATIYDSDASLHGAFSCAPGWTMEREASGKSNYNACYYPTAKYTTTSVADTVIPCIGVTTGMVESTLDPKTKKMKLTSKGQKCFGDQADEAFAALFTATPGINESYYFAIPFYKNYYGKLEFDSDYQQSKGAKVPGGFYPAEVPPDDDMMLSERLPAAEGKRRAEGPVFYCSDPSKNSKTPDGLRTIDATQKIPAYKLICNGPGWDKGIDCEGIYIKGGEFGMGNSLTPLGTEISEKIGVTWIEDGWGWSCAYDAPIDWLHYKDGTETPVLPQDQYGTPRWMSIELHNDSAESAILTTAGRNHHFCLESHATFKYRKGLNFSIVGNDDIWVYINNKLAVDVGGVHISAPGFVDVDKFLPSAKTGDVYDIDIYYCNRRNPTSTLQIATNMILEQSIISPDPYAIASRRTSSNFSQFRVAKTGTLEIAIITSKQNATKQYALLDMKGQVLSAGSLNSIDTRVKVPTAGAYIVKVGRHYKKVNVR